MYKGAIIENSLSDKSILDKVTIENTYQIDDWILHDVLVNEEQIPQLQKCLDNGPWYIHLWMPNRDDIKVIYKEKIFDIKFSDKFTWGKAIIYGKSIGIPEEQLDFLIS